MLVLEGLQDVHDVSWPAPVHGGLRGQRGYGQIGDMMAEVSGGYHDKKPPDHHADGQGPLPAPTRAAPTVAKTLDR